MMPDTNLHIVPPTIVKYTGTGKMYFMIVAVLWVNFPISFMLVNTMLVHIDTTNENDRNKKIYDIFTNVAHVRNNPVNAGSLGFHMLPLMMQRTNPKNVANITVI